ncbi:MAG: hypothetical protein [Microvirus sp.]|nr:MAG: hypothetical protein [Microvirus sp.]
MGNVQASTHHQPKRIKSRHTDKKVFSATADRTQAVNTGTGRPMRGGIRL